MRFIDSFAHIGLPRYLSTEDFLRVMDDCEVEAAVVGATPSCADFPELLRAAQRYGDRLHVVGVPVGSTPREREQSVQAQLDSGFAGIHAGEHVVCDEPALLTQVGERRAVLFVTGSCGLAASAEALLAYLSRFAHAIVCAQGFAGVGDPCQLRAGTPGHRLFSHPRFFVVFCGQGAHQPARAAAWAQAVIGLVGWERAFWGSEFPECLWRGESYVSTTVWVDKAGLNPSIEERDAFFFQNAHRLFFQKAGPMVAMSGSLDHYKQTGLGRPVPLFPNEPIELDEETQQALLSAYLRRSGPGSYRDFIAEELKEAARRVKGEEL